MMGTDVRIMREILGLWGEGKLGWRGGSIDMIGGI
jgi:hypothetical protein